jgi:glycosyltransferase involved in cell wall biosynthesis
MKIREIIAQILAFLFLPRFDVTIVTEDKAWAITQEAKGLANALKVKGLRVRVTAIPRFIKSDKIIFSSLNCFRDDYERRRIQAETSIVWIFHGDFGISADLDRQLKLVVKESSRIDLVMTSCHQMVARLERLGVARNKLMIRPVSLDYEGAFLAKAEGFDPKTFRAEYGIPEGAFLVGSFQKDGNGWEDGNEPKLIKGPDILLEFIERLKTERDVHVILTGPARGYVKNGLEKIGVGYTHIFFEDPDDLSVLYRALDLYVIASREEGGPKALPECLSLQVPIISTPVGATDLLPEEIFRDLICSEISSDALFEKYVEMYDKISSHEYRTRLMDDTRNIFDLRSINDRTVAKILSIGSSK